jgi:hypothetical protein
VTGLAAAERLMRAAEVLDAAGDPKLAPVADGLRRYLEARRTGPGWTASSA